MTDLERVRDEIDRTVLEENGWVQRIDAHLREDGAMTRQYSLALKEQERLRAELARLREVAEQRKNKAKIARAGQQAMGQELARLREALEKIANYGNAVAGAQHTNVSWGRQQMADEARNAIKETT